MLIVCQDGHGCGAVCDAALDCQQHWRLVGLTPHSSDCLAPLCNVVRQPCASDVEAGRGCYVIQLLLLVAGGLQCVSHQSHEVLWAH